MTYAAIVLLLAAAALRLRLTRLLIARACLQTGMAVTDLGARVLDNVKREGRL